MPKSGSAAARAGVSEGGRAESGHARRGELEAEADPKRAKEDRMNRWTGTVITKDPKLLETDAGTRSAGCGSSSSAPASRSQDGYFDVKCFDG